jgi:hypothetical protein
MVRASTLCLFVEGARAVFLKDADFLGVGCVMSRTILGGGCGFKSGASKHVLYSLFFPAQNSIIELITCN